MTVKKKITKKVLAYELLRKDIMEGILKPNERLIITKLAQRYNVSEIPVREAIQQLVSEGYLESLPHVGAMVKSISPEDVREIFELRINLEGLATELAVDNLSNSNLKHLQEILLRSEGINNLEEYDKLNREFHEYIYLHANNKRMFTIISDLWDNSKRYPAIFQTVEDYKKSIKEHKKIFKALEKRDALLAKDIMVEHKTRAYYMLMDLISNN
ncbi:GntR family transcriptional regulator [Virgibacillus kimchii]